ncbi:hypothetical protein BATDEDRAFT_13763 [Batrachochytrium dendrobatidis JAM81]|uniref:Phosphoribosylglycinamide formyltransferase n=1 Tax=Batrachochytrium dendrobatidis (strain JAM81 / FGSC 10211) TaxID=684364 RepID=F4PB31_BATDJ|nr:phosphoribosylglycinamide formyltransferase [Batrachochytrium dendrobatidis JAM81]EGF77651.1 hypothetical protein BATDEDRAFT_13763 [Batrachochytrium dendrobatidis JAM81]|eukprot:XP_006681591.1 hypothetical protein BATDEDRAFT_13763 [Batrachochytrium dendrobatidis JAM81]
MSTPTIACPRIVVLISGNGSNLQAIIDAVAAGHIQAQISLVVSNKTKAYGLERAAQAGIPTMIKTLKPYRDAGKTRIQYDHDLALDINQDSLMPDLIVLAGFMHILSPEFLSHFYPGRIINLHPALPGQFDGAHAIERAFDSFQKGEIQHTGIMVHKVIAEVDRGQVVLQKQVPILESDTVESLQTRIHASEHVLLVDGIIAMLAEHAPHHESH